MEELEYLWEVGCVRPADGSTRYDLWLYPEMGEVTRSFSPDMVTSFDHYPDEEEVLAALAMWKAEHGG